MRTKASISKDVLGITVDVVLQILKVSSNNLMWGKYLHQKEMKLFSWVGWIQLWSSNYVMGGCREGGAMLFPEMCNERRRGKGHNLPLWEFCIHYECGQT